MWQTWELTHRNPPPHSPSHTVLGTLPYIDNFSQIGGFLFGLPAAFIFVPYITIGKWDRAKKFCIVLIAIPVLLLMFVVGLLVFYNLPNPDFCPDCSYIDCIPYTPTFCDDFILSVLSRIIPSWLPHLLRLLLSDNFDHTCVTLMKQS